jgi:hypothetical protein
LLVPGGDEPDCGLVAERRHRAVELNTRESEDHAHAFSAERGHERLPRHPRHQQSPLSPAGPPAPAIFCTAFGL